MHSADNQIKNLYADLLKSEARHFGIYLKLAQKNNAGFDVQVRLEQLAQIESEILSTVHPEPRMHS